jgi:hypothetical protein
MPAFLHSLHEEKPNLVLFHTAAASYLHFNCSKVISTIKLSYKKLENATQGAVYVGGLGVLESIAATRKILRGNLMLHFRFPSHYYTDLSSTIDAVNSCKRLNLG